MGVEVRKPENQLDLKDEPLTFIQISDCLSLLKLHKVHPSPSQSKIKRNPLPGPDKKCFCGGPQDQESCLDQRKIGYAAGHVTL
jgi:hypothetical protein